MDMPNGAVCLVLRNIPEFGGTCCPCRLSIMMADCGPETSIAMEFWPELEVPQIVGTMRELADRLA